MDSTGWAAIAAAVTAAATMILAGITLRMAQKTGELATSTAETNKTTAESLRRSVLLQELTALLPLAEDVRKLRAGGLSEVLLDFDEEYKVTALIRCDQIMEELGIPAVSCFEDPPDEPGFSEEDTTKVR